MLNNDACPQQRSAQDTSATPRCATCSASLQLLWGTPQRATRDLCPAAAAGCGRSCLAGRSRESGRTDRRRRRNRPCAGSQLRGWLLFKRWSIGQLLGAGRMPALWNSNGVGEGGSRGSGDTSLHATGRLLHARTCTPWALLARRHRPKVPRCCAGADCLVIAGVCAQVRLERHHLHPARAHRLRQHLSAVGPELGTQLLICCNRVNQHADIVTC